MNDTQEVSIKFSNTITGDSKLKDYEARLRNIYSYISAINRGQTSAIKQVKNATNDLGNEVDKTNKKTKDMKKMFETAFNVGSIYAVYRASTNLLKAFGQLANKSSAYVENLNLLEVAYANINEKTGKFNESITESSKRIEDFIAKMSDVYGLDESNLTRSFGIFKQLANAMKLPTETAENLSELMVKMTNDIASLYNLDLDRASNALQSALAGQVRPIRTATGADITEKTLQSTVDKLGLTRTISELSYVEKRLIMVISLTDQLKKSQGDYGRTIESVANQIRIMKEQWSRLSRAVGNVFYPILERVLPYLNAILMVLTEIFNLIASLMGFKMPKFDYSGLAGASDATVDLIDGMDEAGASAENLKDKLNGLRGFDKLNVITTPKDSGSSASAGVDPAIMDAFNASFGKYNDMLDEVNMKARKIRDAILDWLGFTDGTYKNLKIIAGILGAIMGYKIIKGITGIITGTSKLGKLLGTGGLYNSIKKISELLKKGTLLSTIATKAKTLVAVIKNSIPLIGGLASTITGANGLSKQFDNIDTSMGKTILHTTELVAGFALVGGPLGAFVGGLTALAIAGIKADEQLTKLAYNKLFGTLNITTEQWLDTLKTSGFALDDLSLKFESVKNTVNSLDEAFNSNMEQLGLYGIKYGELSQKIGDEDLPKITNAIQNTADNATEIVDTTTDYLLTGMKDFFKKGSSLTKEEQEQILQSIYDNGENQKNEIQSIKNRLIEIHANANAQNRDLNEEEYNEVARHLARLKELETGQVSKTNAELEFLHSSFNNKSLQLDEESYNNWKTARDKFEKEQNDIIQKNYETQYNLIMQTIKDEGLRNKSIEDLNNQRLENMKELQEGLNGYDQKIYEDLANTYADIEGKNDEFSSKQKKFIENIFKGIDIKPDEIVNKFATIGGMCSNEFNSALSRGLQNSRIKIPGTDYNASVELEYSNPFYRYANGGLPPVGQLFVANEKGPELIGQIGGQSFVANQNQMMDLLDKKMGANAQPINLTIPVQVGDEKIGTIVLKDLQNMAKTNGKPIVIGG